MRRAAELGPFIFEQRAHGGDVLVGDVPTGTEVGPQVAVLPASIQPTPTPELSGRAAAEVVDRGRLFRRQQRVPAAAARGSRCPARCRRVAGGQVTQGREGLEEVAVRLRQCLWEQDVVAGPQGCVTQFVGALGDRGDRVAVPEAACSSAGSNQRSSASSPLGCSSPKLPAARH